MIIIRKLSALLFFLQYWLVTRVWFRNSQAHLVNTTLNLKRPFEMVSAYIQGIRKALGTLQLSKVFDLQLFQTISEDSILPFWQLGLVWIKQEVILIPASQGRDSRSVLLVYILPTAAHSVLFCAPGRHDRYVYDVSNLWLAFPSLSCLKKWWWDLPLWGKRHLSLATHLWTHRYI